MISVAKTTEGRSIEGDTSVAQFCITVYRAADSKPLKLIDAEGNCVGTACIVFREEIPPDLEVQRQIAAAKQGGCCG